MRTKNEANVLQELMNNELSLESQVNVLFDILKNVLDEGAIRARTVKYKLQKYVKSDSIYERVYALNKIASDGKGIKVVPDSKNIHEVMEEVFGWVSEELARKYIQKKKMEN